MTVDLAITGGRIVDQGQSREGDLLIADGVIGEFQLAAGPST